MVPLPDALGGIGKGRCIVYESADAVCPYYRTHSAKEIRCEGKHRIKVKGWKDAERHILCVCGSHQAWKLCPVAIVLNKKYGVR